MGIKLNSNYEIIYSYQRTQTASNKKNPKPKKDYQNNLMPGYINNFQLSAILAKQKNLKKPIGEYFIKNNLIDKIDIERFVILHKEHNFLYA